MKKYGVKATTQFIDFLHFCDKQDKKCQGDPHIYDTYMQVHCKCFFLMQKHIIVFVNF